MSEEKKAEGIQIKHAEGVVQVTMIVSEGEETLAVSAGLTPEGAVSLAQGLVYYAAHAAGVADDVEE